MLEYQENFAFWFFDDLVNMDKVWHRSVIRYLQKKGLTPMKIHADMVSIFGDDALASSTVKKWAAEFKTERESLKNDPR